MATYSSSSASSSPRTSKQYSSTDFQGNLKKSSSLSSLSSNPSPNTSSTNLKQSVLKQSAEEIATDIENWLHPLILCTAAARGETDKLKEFVETRGFDPKGSDYDGRTPLHLACEEGHLEVVKYLVKAGADVNCQDRWGTTPMRGALMFNRRDIAMFLKENGGTLGFSQKLLPGVAAVKSEEKTEALQAAFANLDPTRMYLTPPLSIPLTSITKYFQDIGISIKKHQLVAKQLKELHDLSGGNGEVKFSEFSKVMSDPDSFLNRAFRNSLVVTDWKAFCKEVTDIFESCRGINEGKLPDYIPELAEVDAELWGLSIMTVDGQVLKLGDFGIDFSVQSCGKPLLYAFCAEDVGINKIHEHVGREPSGVAFNAFTLNSQKKPHNPFINSGAIMTSSLFYPNLVLSKRFKILTESLSKLAGGQKVGFNQSVYLSEKSVAHRNYALAHFMYSEGGFPEKVDILDTVDFYFQMCSCEMSCQSMASVAATFANNGKSPISDKKVLSSPIVKSTLQLMYSCGMYDFSGEWACTVGLPAKSGVSGCIYAVIPDVMGIAVYSPRLDSHGNSVRGIEFYKRLVAKFKWNLFDIMFSKLDLRG